MSTRERSALRIFRRGRSEWPWGAFRSTGVARNDSGARFARQGSLRTVLERHLLDKARSQCLSINRRRTQNARTAKKRMQKACEMHP